LCWQRRPTDINGNLIFMMLSEVLPRRQRGPPRRVFEQLFRYIGDWVAQIGKSSPIIVRATLLYEMLLSFLPSVISLSICAGGLGHHRGLRPR